MSRRYHDPILYVGRNRALAHADNGLGFDEGIAARFRATDTDNHQPTDVKVVIDAVKGKRRRR